VLRGGSWNNNPRNCRSANRNRSNPDNRNDNNGFRVAVAAGVDRLFPLTPPAARLRDRAISALPSAEGGK
jgi:hypothetical protein